MKSIKRGLPALGVGAVLQLAIAQAYAGPLALSQTPLFLTSANKANVLMMYGNSNSMDSDPTGKAVGSDAASSKSEIARKAIISVVESYTGYINLGLLAYQQNPLVTQWLHDSQYDASYDGANFDPGFSGARNSATKKFSIVNPTSAGDKVYFNVNLPYYDPSNQGNGFCYSSTACTSPANDFSGRSGNCGVPEHPTAGPWDGYSCYKTKSGASDAAPGSAGANYGGGNFNTSFSPTDSDLGQGITDFGKRMAYQAVSLAWFNNGAPGKGYLHLPVAALDAAQAAKVKKKLATSQFASNQPVNPDYPLQNAGLSPLAGTVATANSYFAGSLSAPAQGGPVGAPPNSCQKNFLVTLTDGLPSVTPAGVASADVVANLAGLTDETAALLASGAKAQTYVVGFALPYGVSISQLDNIAAAGGSTSAYYANDTDTLNAAFAKIFADILSKTSAASAVALNSQSVSTGAHVFQARFSSGDWSGQLLKLPFHEVQVGQKIVRRVNPAAPVWNAATLLNARTPDSRVILSTKPSTKTGIAFRWPALPAAPVATELDVEQVTALATNAQGVADGNAAGAARLEYLRGAVDNEGALGLKFRSRPVSRLGDIVNSSPAYVGKPDGNYGLPGYAAFELARKTRAPMLYVGANDGMLHGFDAGSGQERLAYVPGAVYGNLSKLSAPAYVHRYFVDGAPSVGDVRFAGGAWRTMLVGSLGGGGRGIFGLDVTDPANFTEANAATLVKFEITGAEADFTDIGVISGPVSLVKLNSGKWAAVFGNGYNSSANSGAGIAALFVVDVETGALIRKLDIDPAGFTGANGLATPLLIDKDSNYTVDTAYAGDLAGNLWKFDLSSSDPQQWSVAYKLFNAGQPITSAPEAGEHPKGGYMVYFGTGKYLEQSDIASAPGNAIYGIWDDGSGQVAANTLLSQTYTDIPAIGGVAYRTATSHAIDWLSQRGWKASYPSAPERSVSAPQLRDGRLIFVSLIPSSVECSPGGTSWLNEVDWLTGGQLSTPPLDTNNDQQVNSSDTLVSGRAIDGVVAPPAIQSGVGGPDSSLESNLTNTSNGEVGDFLGAGSPKRARRLSWRQIK
jgi:type IV pilus assembly protein PilY1